MRLNWANRITILRILLIIPFVGFMLKINDANLTEQTRYLLRYISIVIFLAMAISDGLDGYLARKKGQITTLGSFLDPLADKLLMTCTCLLLASDRAMVTGFKLPTTVVVLIVGKDLFLLIGFVIIYFITAKIHIVPATIGKIATTLQLVMVSGVLLGPEIAKIVPFWRDVLPFLWWPAAGTAILATLIYIRHGSRYIEKYEQ